MNNDNERRPIPQRRESEVTSRASGASEAPEVPNAEMQKRGKTVSAQNTQSAPHTPSARASRPIPSRTIPQTSSAQGHGGSQDAFIAQGTDAAREADVFQSTATPRRSPDGTQSAADLSRIPPQRRSIPSTQPRSSARFGAAGGSGAAGTTGVSETAGHSGASGTSGAQGRPVRRQASGGVSATMPPMQNHGDIGTDTVDLRAVSSSSTRVIPAQSKNDEPKETPMPLKKRKRAKGDSGLLTRLREESDNAVISLVKAAIYLVVVLVVSIIISVTAILVGNDMYAFVKEDSEVEIVVPVGATVSDLTDILADAGLIKYPKIFKFYADHKTKDNENFATLEFVPADYEMPEKKSAAFIAGTYKLNSNMDYEDLLWSFLPPGKTGTSWVTVPEGFTTDEIIDLLVENGIGKREKYIEVINTYDFSSFWFVKELEESGRWSAEEYKRDGKVSSGRIYRLDGYLFPDTYEFYNASKEETVIRKMLTRFAQIFNKEYRDLTEAQGFTVDDLITLSSMVEKEANNPNDFFKVSEVFRNRMKNPTQYPYMQSDATVLYQIHHETGKRPKHVTHDDTLLEVPYNTYTNQGLPPGPISNPSATAIVAALNPSSNGYYFFVSGPEETHFSTNQWDHNYWVGVTAQEWANLPES